MPKEPAPITMPAEKSDSEEMGGFEAYSEQSVLSPIAYEATPAQIKAKKREIEG